VKKILLYLTLMQLPIAVLAQDYLPRDVQRFVDRREGCDHMRGELDRLNELSREMRKLCGGTDKELAQLKRKYAANSTIMQILNQFEASIEAAEAATPKRGEPKRNG
jgi:predicted oxidoreductase